MKKLFSLLFVALLSMTAWGKVVTFDFTTNGWNLPVGSANIATAAEQFTNGDGYTITLEAASSGYYYNANGFLMLGKTDATLTFPAFSTKVEKIAVTGTSGASASVLQNIFVGTTPVSTETTGAKNVTNEYVIDANYQTVGTIYIFKVNSNHNTQISKIEITLEDPPVEAPVFNPNGGEFSVTSLAVTVSCPTENASIYLYKVVDGEIDYTTGQYFFQSGEFYVTETSTYTAYAYKGSDMSDYTTVTFTKVAPHCDAPTFNPESGTTFDNELVVTITGPEGSTIYYVVNDSPEYEVTSPATVNLTETSTITAYAELDGVESDIVEATYTKNEVTPPEPWQGTESYLASRDKGDFGGSAGAFNVFKEDRPGINIAFSNGTIASYDNVYAYRIYKNSTLTFTSEVGNITAIEFIGVDGNPVSNFGEVEGMTYEGNNGTWIGDAATVIFKAVTAQVRCTEIRVTVGQQAVIVAAPVITPENNTVFAGEQEVTITCSTEGAEIYYTINDGDETLYEGPFTVDATSTVKAYAKVGDAVSPEVSAKFILGTAIENITDGNTVGEYYIYNGEAVVTWQNGSYTWIRDNSGSGLIYGYQVPKLNQGDVLKAGWTANYIVYNDVLPEFRYPMSVEASGNTATVEPLERATATAANVNEYVVLKGITVLTDTTNTKKFYNAADSLVLYNQFSIPDSVLNIENGKTYDVEGLVTYHNTTLEVYITAVNEVAAQEWALGDVNHDTYVNVADVTAMIKYILTSGEEPEEFYRDQANVDGDAEDTINVADVTSLIQLVLNGSSK